MSDKTTKRLIAPFLQMAMAPMFLSGFFKSPPQNYHTSETVEIDIQRDGEDVAIAITDVSTGQRYNDGAEKYSNKEFKPPIFDEVATVSAFELLGRDAGENPFEANPDFQAKGILRAYRKFEKLQNKIRRAIEQMASQVLTTGILSLVDKNGNVVYTLNFAPKASHFPTVSTAWHPAGSAGDPLGDLGALAAVIRTDGQRNPDVLAFSDGAFARFTRNPDVQKAISRDGLGVGQLTPEKRGNGATFQGFVWIGSYRFEMWTYTGGYVHPQTGAQTPYIPSDKVIMLSQAARLDLTFGRIPLLNPNLPKALPALPSRIMDGDRGIDLSTHSWFAPDGKSLSVSAGTRPLTSPTEIDSFGCVDVVP
jgi:hypothetical protein